MQIFLVAFLKLFHDTLQGDVTDHSPTPQPGLRAPSLSSFSVLCPCLYYFIVFTMLLEMISSCICIIEFMRAVTDIIHLSIPITNNLFILIIYGIPLIDTVLRSVLYTVSIDIPRLCTTSVHTQVS